MRQRACRQQSNAVHGEAGAGVTIVVGQTPDALTADVSTLAAIWSPSNQSALGSSGRRAIGDPDERIRSLALWVGSSGLSLGFFGHEVSALIWMGEHVVTNAPDGEKLDACVG